MTFHFSTLSYVSNEHYFFTSLYYINWLFGQ